MSQTTEPEALVSLAHNALQDHLARLAALLAAGAALLDQLELSSETSSSLRDAGAREHLSQLVEMAGELTDEVSSGLVGPWTSARGFLQDHLARLMALLLAGATLLDQLEPSSDLEHLSQLVEMAGEQADEVSSGLDELLLSCDVRESGMRVDEAPAVTRVDEAPRQEAPAVTRMDGTSVQKSVREYLDGLVWDQVPRIDRWLIDCAGAFDTESIRRVSRMALVDAVRRVNHPGCALEGMLVLDGPQGSGKSEALRILAVDASRYIDDMETSFLMEATKGQWIVEVPLTGVSSDDVAGLTECFFRRVDEARLAYQVTPTRVPRQFVIVGTTNETDADGYLREAPGNLRFQPVRIQRFNLARLRADRDQLWAEAVVAEASETAVQERRGVWPPNRCRATDAAMLFYNHLPRALARVTVLHLLPAASYYFKVSGDASGPSSEWLIDCTVVPPTCVRTGGGRPRIVTHSVEISHSDLGVLLEKPDNSMMMYFQGKLRLGGDPLTMFKFEQLFNLVAALEASEEEDARA
jgi:hypothetical protein